MSKPTNTFVLNNGLWVSFLTFADDYFFGQLSPDQLVDKARGHLGIIENYLVDADVKSRINAQAAMGMSLSTFSNISKTITAPLLLAETIGQELSLPITLGSFDTPLILTILTDEGLKKYYAPFADIKDLNAQMSEGKRPISLIDGQKKKMDSVKAQQNKL